LGTARAMPVISSATKYSSLPLRLLTNGQSSSPANTNSTPSTEFGIMARKAKANSPKASAMTMNRAPIMMGAPAAYCEYDSRHEIRAP